MPARLLGPDDLALLLGTAPGLFDQPVDPVQAQAFLADPLHRIAAVLEQDEILAFASGTILLHPDCTPTSNRRSSSTKSAPARGIVAGVMPRPP